MDNNLWQAKSWIYEWNLEFARKLELVQFMPWDEAMARGRAIDPEAVALMDREHTSAAYIPTFWAIALRDSSPDALRLAMILVHEGTHAIEHLDGTFRPSMLGDPQVTVDIENRAWTAEAKFASWFLAEHEVPENAPSSTTELAGKLVFLLTTYGDIDVYDLGSGSGDFYEAV